MSDSVIDSAVIIAEPMSTLPISRPSSPVKPSLTSGTSTSRPPTPSPALSTYTFPRPLSPAKSEALKANPHPYPIRTTSTGVLSRSNSTAGTNPYQYQYYVPQSPGSPSKEFKPMPVDEDGKGKGNGDKEKRGGKHRYSRSLNSNTGPTPLPAPPTFGNRSRTGSTSSLSSSGSRSPAKAGDNVDVFGDVSHPAPSKRTRAETMPPSAAAGIRASISDGEGLEDAEGNKTRGRTSRTLGSIAGGRVRGMVASFERSASRGGEDEGRDNVPSSEQEGSYVRHGYGRRRARYRRESATSELSMSSAESFGSYDIVNDDNEPADQDAMQVQSSSFDSTPKRNQNHPESIKQDGDDEPSIEELLASTPWDATSYPKHIPGGTINDETVKLQDPVYSTVTPASITCDISGPSIPRYQNLDDEMSIEDLLTTLSSTGPDRSLFKNTGASAWERDVGSTVKHVSGSDVITQDSGRIRSRRDKKKDQTKRLDGVFAITGIQSESDEDSVASSHSASGFPAIPQPPSPSVSDRELRLEQEMSETRHMLRALSARVAGVEAKIGEMEVVAGELEVRGRRLVEGEGAKLDGSVSGASPQSELREQPTLAKRLLVTFTRSVVGVAQSFVEGDGACATLARTFIPSITRHAVSDAGASSASSPSSASAKARSREVSRSRAAALPVWYKKSWTCYLIFLGLGACAFVLREVVRRGLMLRERRK